MRTQPWAGWLLGLSPLYLAILFVVDPQSDLRLLLEDVEIPGTAVKVAQRILSALAIAILLIAATILIGNTIRLSIFARRREIEVMKLVGASNLFVRGYKQDSVSLPNKGPVYRKIGRRKLVPYYDRGEIEDGVIAGRGLEICYLKEQTDLLFSQIQGSARVSLDDGSTVRINYDAHNGYPYTPVGRILIDRVTVANQAGGVQSALAGAAAGAAGVDPNRLPAGSTGLNERGPAADRFRRARPRPRRGAPGPGRRRSAAPRGGRGDRAEGSDRDEQKSQGWTPFILDTNGNGALSFEEWAAKTIDKFKGADADKSGWLTAVETSAVLSAYGLPVIETTLAPVIPPGAPIGTSALESCVDELARKSDCRRAFGARRVGRGHTHRPECQHGPPRRRDRAGR